MERTRHDRTGSFYPDSSKRKGAVQLDFPAVALTGFARGHPPPQFLDPRARDGLSWASTVMSSGGLTRGARAARARVPVRS